MSGPEVQRAGGLDKRRGSLFGECNLSVFRLRLRGDLTAARSDLQMQLSSCRAVKTLLVYCNRYFVNMPARYPLDIHKECLSLGCVLEGKGIRL